MAKDIAYDTEARGALKKGVDKLANAVKVTLGPNVTLTAFASLSTPFLSELLASVSYAISFAIFSSL